ESFEGVLKKGSTSLLAEKYGVSKRSISRIWHRARLQVLHGSVVDVSSKKTRVVGRKRIQIDFTQVSQILLRRRTNIRTLAKSIDVPKSLVHRRIKKGELRPYTNAVKPHLTDENKKARLRFCLSMVTPSFLSFSPTFKDMYNIIYIDEKWFYMSRPTKRYYLVPGEDDPLRTRKSKKFITKVMFLAAVTRPRYDSLGTETFLGKIGIFPLTTLEPAKRSSKNRVAGTLEIKPILSVTKEVTRSWLIQKVLPAIRSTWPQGYTGPIFIQQDNAKPHINVDDVEFLQEASRDGFDIRLRFQPPNSPDLNVLDLGFFWAIQSLQEQEVLETIDGLVHAVQASYERMPSCERNNVFLTLQTCMKEILKVQGSNNYQTPHIGKGRLERQGMLPLTIDCQQSLIDQAISYLGE
nr:transposase, Tc1-like protein [Tanacetum cinerariifolium]